MKAEVDFKSTNRSYLFFCVFVGGIDHSREVWCGVRASGGRGVCWQPWEEQATLTVSTIRDEGGDLFS